MDFLLQLITYIPLVKVAAVISTSCPVDLYYIFGLAYNIKSDFYSFSMFDLDQDTKCGKKSQDCCSHQWLMLKTEKHGIRKRRDILSKVTNNRRKSRESAEDSLKRIIQSHKLLKGHLFKDMGRIGRRRLINRQLSLRNRKRSNDTSGSNTTSPHRLSQSRTPFNPSEFTSTGHVCGNSTPWPIITRSPKVVVKFYSDTKVRRDHLGFTLQFFISEFMMCLFFFIDINVL